MMSGYSGYQIKKNEGTQLGPTKKFGFMDKHLTEFSMYQIVFNIYVEIVMLVFSFWNIA